VDPPAAASRAEASPEAARPGAAAPGPEPDRPAGPRLRRATKDLLLALPEAQTTPELASLPVGPVCSGSTTDWVENPLSAARSNPRLRRFNRLVITRPAKGTVQSRDALVLPLDVTARWTLTLPPEAAVEFGLLGLSCQRGGPIDVVVGVEPREGGSQVAWRRTIQAQGPTGKREWEDHRIDLSAWSGRDVTLALAVVGQGAQPPVGLAPGVLHGYGMARPPDHRAAALLAQPVVTGRPAPDPADPTIDRSVLLVIVDALRGDVVGPGRKMTDFQTPTMDAIVASGVSFANAFAVSNQTRQATLAMLTGQPPTLGLFHSAWWTMKPFRKIPFYDSEPALVTRQARALGWRVEHFGHNHFLFEELPIGLDHGFQHIWDDRRDNWDAPALVAKTIEFLRAHQDERFFIVLNLVQPHTPYTPPEAWEKKIYAQFPDERPDGLHRKYLAEVAYADSELAKVVAAVDELGLRDRLVIALTADHGEVMDGAHACYSERFKMNCHMSHGMTLYDEELHVPLAFAGAGVTKPGHVERTPVSLLDFAPTLQGLLGIPRDPRQAGLDLRPALAGEPVPTRPIYAETRAAVALREGGTKLILHNKLDDTWTPARTGNSGRRDVYVQLFDLTADPREHVNLALRDDPRLPALKARVEEVRRLFGTPIERWPAELRGPLPDDPAALAAGGAPGAAGGPAASARVAAAVVAGAAPTEATPGAGAFPGLPVVPLAPPAGATTTQAVQQLVLNADGGAHRLAGTIHLAGGRLRCLELASDGDGGAARCRSDGNGRIEVELTAAAREARVAFAASPADAPLALALQLDGAPLPPQRFFVGRYGVALADPAQPLDAAGLERATTAARPRWVSGRDLGVFFWRAPPETVAAPASGAPGAVELDPAVGVGMGIEAMDMGGGEQEMAPEVEKVLKELGYTR
jgi:arylsulfatase A-like enzyme